MSAAPIREELAELAVQRLDGDIPDEAWSALERQHGDALTQALAREAATRDALRALPREPAPKPVVEAILAHAKASAAAAKPAPAATGGSLRWWAGAAVLAAACLVSAIVLRVAHAETRPGGSATAGETRVARVEPAPTANERSGQFLGNAGAPPAAPTAAAPAPQVAMRERREQLGRGKDAAAKPDQAAERLAAASGTFGADDAKPAADDRAVAAIGGAADKSEGLAKLDGAAKAKKTDELEQLREEGQAWRLAHPAAAKVAAAPPPPAVLEEAEAAGADSDKRLADRQIAAGTPKGSAEPAPPAATDGAPAALDLAPDDGPVVARAEPERKDSETAAPAGGAPGGSAFRAEAPRPVAPPLANGSDTLKQFEPQEGPAAAEARRGGAASLLALLSYDDARTAVMTLENRAAEPLPVRRASLTLEGIGADGAAVWTLTTGQPESDITLAPRARESWRAPLAGAAALQGAVKLRLRFLDIVSTDVPWPPTPIAAPAAAPAKP